MIIYVLPTEGGSPPRALIGEPMPEEGAVYATISTWSADMGAWTIDDIPVPEDLNEAITEHAKSLGVEW